MGHYFSNGICMHCLNISKPKKFGLTNEKMDSGLKHVGVRVRSRYFDGAWGKSSCRGEPGEVGRGRIETPPFLVSSCFQMNFVHI